MSAPLRTVRFTVTGSVLISDADFQKLWLHDPAMQTTWASRIQSHMGEAPLLDGRENSTRVSLIVDEAPKELQLVA